MLDTETKKRIDSARDILVGKLPDPKSQVEQITIALIYKFMDDMDKESVELGGKAKFFSGEYKRYSWSSIFDPRIGGSELVAIYGEAILKMNQNPNIPQLFRDIFKNAFLPYRDPETLKSFLKIIDQFNYDHSEMLGDAFEYLLSILGSQGDAGQFRTPRHIIDFIVSIVDPQKGESILDPACGTAGFLISAYKHIIKQNEKKKLSPDEKKNLMENLVGYDISPDMVRLSRVNMYLHGFRNPKIYEYDSLTSEEKWGESFNVIMANPPFMTPKGGIKPHKRFSFKSRRTEALFVDYLIEHLKSNGKAGIIVPDGIVNNKTFLKLRQILIKNGLYAVVSLHQYVFKPYAGAKTCILFFDKTIKDNPGNILFAEMDNDGFQKGVQRLEIDSNDIPEISRLLVDFKTSKKALSLDVSRYSVNATIVNINSLDKNIYYHYVDLQTLFPNTFIYKNSVAINNNKAIRIADVFTIKKGVLQSTKATPGQYRFVTASNEYLTHEEYKNDGEAIVIAVAAGGSLGKAQYVNEKFIASDLCFVITPKQKKKTDILFYLYYFKNIRTRLVKILAKGVSKPSINKTDFGNLIIDNVDLADQIKLGKQVRATRDKIKELEININKIEDELVAAVEIVRKSNSN